MEYSNLKIIDFRIDNYKVDSVLEFYLEKCVEDAENVFNMNMKENGFESYFTDFTANFFDRTMAIDRSDLKDIKTIYTHYNSEGFIPTDNLKYALVASGIDYKNLLHGSDCFSNICCEVYNEITAFNPYQQEELSVKLQNNHLQGNLIDKEIDDIYNDITKETPIYDKAKIIRMLLEIPSAKRILTVTRYDLEKVYEICGDLYDIVAPHATKQRLFEGTLAFNILCDNYFDRGKLKNKELSLAGKQLLITMTEIESYYIKENENGMYLPYPTLEFKDHDKLEKIKNLARASYIADGNILIPYIRIFEEFMRKQNITFNITDTISEVLNDERPEWILEKYYPEKYKNK